MTPKKPAGTHSLESPIPLEDLRGMLQAELQILREELRIVRGMLERVLQPPSKQTGPKCATDHIREILKELLSPGAVTRPRDRRAIEAMQPLFDSRNEVPLLEVCETLWPGMQLKKSVGLFRGLKKQVNDILQRTRASARLVHQQDNSPFEHKTVYFALLEQTH